MTDEQEEQLKQLNEEKLDEDPFEKTLWRT